VSTELTPTELRVSIPVGEMRGRETIYKLPRLLEVLSK